MRFLRSVVTQAFSLGANGLGACPGISQMQMRCPPGQVISPDGTRCLPAVPSGIGQVSFLRTSMPSTFMPRVSSRGVFVPNMNVARPTFRTPVSIATPFPTLSAPSCGTGGTVKTVKLGTRNGRPVEFEYCCEGDNYDLNEDTQKSTIASRCTYLGAK